MRSGVVTPTLGQRSQWAELMYEWIVYLHVLGAFAFVLAHGTSMIVAFRLRSVRDRNRVVALLELSQIANGAMYVGLLLLLGAGVWAGFVGAHWGRLWIWLSLGVLGLVLVVMYAVATPFYGRMRAAAGLPGYAEVADRYDPPVTPDDLSMLARSRRPEILALVGGVGLVFIVWLMVIKPF